MRRFAGLVAAVLLLAACGGGDDDATTTTTTTTTTSTSPEGTVPDGAAPAAELEAVSLTLSEVADLDEPLAMTWCEGHDTAYVAEKGGRVVSLEGTEVLDLSGEVNTGSEQGLLGIACAPDGSSLVVSYSDLDGATQVHELPWSADGDQLDRDGGRTLLEVRQPAANHNGGNVVFGPDGELWLGLGDGGGRDDQFDNAQEPGQVLGSLLRLDRSGGEPEIVMKGLRNPWRFSFDRETGDLWIGDVGQGAREEIDHLPAGSFEGANLGWPALEGTRRHRQDVEVPPDVVDPVFEYGRDEGQSVVGGYVYRGDAIPALRGAYLFADTYTAALRAIVVDDDEVVTGRTFEVTPGGLVSSFAEGPGGELYVLSLDGGVHRLDPA